MRVSGQLAVIAVLGAAGFGGWYAYKGGHLAKLPVIGSYVSQPPTQQAGGPGGRAAAVRQALRRSTSTSSRPGASSRCGRRSARCVPSNRSP